MSDFAIPFIIIGFICCTRKRATNNISGIQVLWDTSGLVLTETVLVRHAKSKYINTNPMKVKIKWKSRDLRNFIMTKKFLMHLYLAHKQNTIQYGISLYRIWWNINSIIFSFFGRSSCTIQLYHHLIR